MTRNTKVYLFFLLLGPKAWDAAMAGGWSWILWVFGIMGFFGALKAFAFPNNKRERW